MQKRQYRGRLGEYLIEMGHLKIRDLERALEIQRVAGGHLGTNLLELDVVAEEILLDAIGKMHENPTVSGRRLAKIPKEVSSKIPRDLVRRHSIVPFALHGNTVYIASQRPGDIHIENEVTLATSRLTRTFVGLEVRVQAALHRFHGHSLPIRFSRLIAKLDGEEGSDPFLTARQAPHSATLLAPKSTQEDAAWPSPDKGDFDPTLASTVGRKIVWNDFETENEPAPPASPLTPIPSNGAGAQQAAGAKLRTPSKTGATTEETVVQAEVETKRTSSPESGLHRFSISANGPRKRRPRKQLAKLPSSPEASSKVSQVEARTFASVSSPTRPSVASLEDAHAALLEASNRDTVGKILMEGLRPFFKRRLLLAKRGDQLLGWRADGPGIRPKNLSNLRFPLSSGSPFLAIENGSRFWLSAYHQDAGYQAISSTIGPIQAPDCMILPLRAGKHIVGFLYGDNEEVTVTGQPLLQFLQFSEAAGTSFERIIRRLKESRMKSTNSSEIKAGDASMEEDPWRPSGGAPNKS